METAVKLAIAFVADLVRESQRAPAIGFGAILIALTIAIAATTLGGRGEALILGGVIGLFQLADQLPFVRLAPYVDTLGEGDLSFSLDGSHAAGAFMDDVLLPLYAWLTGALVALRWALRRPFAAGGFLSRMRAPALLTGACLMVFLITSLARSDVAALWPAFCIFGAVFLILSAWAAGVGRMLDALADRITGERPQPD